MPLPFVIQRVDRFMFYGTDRNNKRFMFCQTWAHDGDLAGSFYFLLLNVLLPLIKQPFGNHADLVYDKINENIETLWPSRHIAAAFDLVARPTILTLNPAAPEASFRLQRVGAGGSIGRTLYPILTDRYYVDLPHRRHVDITTLSTWLAAADDPHRYDITTFLGRSRQVIWNRRTETCDFVTHFRILSNPVRKWQRWRNYDYARFHTKDAAWQPPPSR